MNARMVVLGGWVLLVGCPSPSVPDASINPSTDAGSEPTARLDLDDRDLDLGIGLEDAMLSTTVRLRNVGTQTLTLGQATQLSGDPAFRVQFFEGTQLASGETSDVTVSITLPRTGALRRFQAQFRLTTAEGVEELLDVRARGTPAFLTWAPGTVDFEFSPPTLPVIREVVFSNFSLQPVQLSRLEAREGTTSSTVFSSLVSTREVPAAVLSASAPEGLVPGRATVEVRFTPSVLGPRMGVLQGESNVPTQSAFSIPLRGQGGGPVIDVQPFPVLDLGRVAYFFNGGSFASGSLVLQNIGTRPFPADPRGNLKLGNGQGVFWEVTPQAGSSLSEICVGDFDESTGSCTPNLAGYDPQVGIVAGAGQEVSIPVRVTPNGLGQRRFELRIFSNDRRTPEKIIAIVVDAVSRPPCDVEVTPTTLDFGLAAPPMPRELAVTVRNRLTGPNDLCFMSNLQLLAQTPVPGVPTQVFSLTEPWVDVELAPGASKQVVVRAQSIGPVPPTPTEVSTKLVFNLARTIAPRVEVPVSITLAVPCLSVGPASLDFGTVGATCSSPVRTLQVFNACPTDVVIDSTSVSGDFVQLNPPMPGTRVFASGAGPVTFSLEFRPQNLGAAFGALSLAVTENGQARNYVVPLQGRADSMGLNTDSFVQRSNTKGDLLFVIDNSSTMGTRQLGLGQAVAPFFAGSTLQPDVRLGVTNTEFVGPMSASAGALHSTDAGVKIVTPFVPGAANAVMELMMNVGSSGSVESCMEPATRAVTAPYITDPTKNAGFLREDATLDIICMTDARDQAPGLPASYLNRMSAAKPPGQLRYHVIGPFLPMAPPGCVYDDPNDGAHDFMVEQTNGTKIEICSRDWQLSVETLIARSFDYRVSFELHARPDPMVPITVRIDGAAVPPVDPQLMRTIWSYDAIRNAVVFERLYVPEPGKTVTVSYRAPCLP